MDAVKVLAIDLGASSGRLMQAVFDGSSLQLSEVHRFKNEPVTINDGLYWNLLHLFDEIKKGIHKASQDMIPIQSISVDTWGVDYAYLDKSGDLLYQPHCYRDNRMGRYEDALYQLLDKYELFEETGVQPSTINTLTQLYADLQEKPHLVETAQRVLFMPDLINYLLSGVLTNEYTISSTSGLLNSQTQTWSDKVFDTLGIPKHWFGDITKGGAVLRELSPRITQALRIEPFQVVTGAGHDTASAVLAIPYVDEQPAAFISCGTWSLVGIEADQPVITREAFEAGVTNEGCFDGKYRILKNTTGLWILQELQRDWRLRGEEISFAEMTQLAREATHTNAWIQPNEAVFASPGDMEAKILEQCRITGQPVPQTKGEVVRVVLESLALAYRETIEQLEQLTNQKIARIQMVGGGIQNTLLCQLTADYTGREVVAGPIEGSALGNVLAQLWTLKQVTSRQECVALVKSAEQTWHYSPQPNNKVEVAYTPYQNL